MMREEVLSRAKHMVLNKSDGVFDIIISKLEFHSVAKMVRGSIWLWMAKSCQTQKTYGMGSYFW